MIICMGIEGYENICLLICIGSKEFKSICTQLLDMNVIVNGLQRLDVNDAVTQLEHKYFKGEHGWPKVWMHTCCLPTP